MESIARGILILFILILISMMGAFFMAAFSESKFIKVPTLPMAEEVEEVIENVSP